MSTSSTHVMHIDAHCHIDAYEKPYEVVKESERAHVLIIAVTNSPSDFAGFLPRVHGMPYVRPALGLHPLLGSRHTSERELFSRYFERTSFIGEVGLDFSREGMPTREEQIVSFKHVLEHLRSRRKFVSIHSRCAEPVVVRMVEEAGVGPVVFHWFSGPQAQLERLLAAGHLCSVNPAMVRSASGRRIIAALPQDRTLTETDGPYTQLSGRYTKPVDVAVVEQFLAELWRMPVSEIRVQIRANLKYAVPMQ